MVRLRDLGGTYGGLTGKTKADFGHGSGTFVTFMEVINSTRLKGNSLERVQIKKGERQNQVLRGDLLFNGSSETPEEVALSAVVDFDPKEWTYLNSFCFGYRLRPDAQADPTFLAYFFRAPAGRSMVASLAQGATRYNIAKTKFLDLNVDLPDMGRQSGIVNALGHADELTSGLERLIAKKRAIRQGMLQQLLTGMTRLPGFTGKWTSSTVGAVAEVKTGPFGSSLHESDYVASGTPIITVEHLGEFGVVRTGAPMVSASDRRRLIAYSLKEGDIVFSRVGSIDRNALISCQEEGWLFSGRLLRVRFDAATADPRFMSAQFHSRRFKDLVRSVAVGQTMPSLNTAILKSIEIVTPPVEEQRAIGQVAQELDAELLRLECRLQKARAIRKGMLQELLPARPRLTVTEQV